MRVLCLDKEARSKELSGTCGLRILYDFKCHCQACRVKRPNVLSSIWSAFTGSIFRFIAPETEQLSYILYTCSTSTFYLTLRNFDRISRLLICFKYRFLSSNGDSQSCLTTDLILTLRRKRLPSNFRLSFCLALGPSLFILPNLLPGAIWNADTALLLPISTHDEPTPTPRWTGLLSASADSTTLYFK